jgi:hypothetical protein
VVYLAYKQMSNMFSPLNLIRLLTIFPIYPYIHVPHIFPIYFGAFMHLKIRGLNHSNNFRPMYPAQCFSMYVCMPTYERVEYL